MAKRPALGSGLGAFLEDNSSDLQTKLTLRVSEIEPNKAQPRRNFDDESLASLADSIRQRGVLQPLLVRPVNGGMYQIIAGERRWRAARMLGLDEVPVIVMDIDDMETMQLALVENLQRENLNPIEEALGYRELIDVYGMKQDEVAKTVGKSRSAVANMLRLLNLPEAIQKLVRNNDITFGHAKVLAGVDDEELLMFLAKKAAQDKITVRAMEKIIAKAEIEDENPPTSRQDSFFKEMEISLNERLQRKVKVNFANNKGTLTLEFYDKDDLSDIASKLALD